MAEVIADADRRVAAARQETDAANEQAKKLNDSLKSLNAAFKGLRADDNLVRTCVAFLVFSKGHPWLQS